MISKGPLEAQPVLAGLEAVASEGKILAPSFFCLAGLHLAPMISYFSMATEGKAEMSQRLALSGWFS